MKRHKISKWHSATPTQKAGAIIKGTWALIMYTTQVVAGAIALYILGALYFLTFPPV